VLAQVVAVQVLLFLQLANHLPSEYISNIMRCIKEMAGDREI